MKFPTHAVIGVTTGKLLGDIDGIYRVMSFMLGRPSFTHELAYYGKRAEVLIRRSLPSLPGEFAATHVNKDNFKECLAAWEREFGESFGILKLENGTALSRGH